MNFLAHYLTSPYKESPYIVCGCLLPDIARGFSKVYNRTIKRNTINDNTHFAHLDRGVALHVAGDALFHEHPFFKLHEGNAKLNLLEFTQVPRQFIVAHVMVELLIDHHLILQDKSLGDSFYHQLNDVNEGVLNGYLASKNLDLDIAKFLRNFKHFKNAKYLFELQVIEGVGVALRQIFGNSLGVSITVDSNLLQAINVTYRNMKSGITPMLKEISNHLV